MTSLLYTDGRPIPSLAILPQYGESRRIGTLRQVGLADKVKICNQNPWEETGR